MKGDMFMKASLSEILKYFGLFDKVNIRTLTQYQIIILIKKYYSEVISF